MKKHASTIALVLVFLLGVCILLYPFVSDYVNSLHQSRVVSTYTQAVEDMSKDDREALRQDAQAFNEALAEASMGQFRPLSDALQQRYSQLLNVSGESVMAYVDIPRLNVKLGIYHGTSDPVLQVGVGHLEGSSLPVGGPSTHCVLVGHRGLPSSKLFTDLDKLQVGDTFSVNCLDEKMWYEVDQILIVEPDDTAALVIEEGEDLCTLVTCTPYGINTHRLLVRGHRVDGPADIDVGSDAFLVDGIVVAGVITVLMLIALGIALALRSRAKKCRKLAGAAHEGRVSAAAKAPFGDPRRANAPDKGRQAPPRQGRSGRLAPKASNYDANNPEPLSGEGFWADLQPYSPEQFKRDGRTGSQDALNAGGPQRSRLKGRHGNEQ